MRKIHIGMPIPGWLPLKSELSVYWKTLKFRLLKKKLYKEFYCQDCGIGVEYRAAEYQQKTFFKHKKCMVSCFKDTFCRTCLAKRIHEWYAMSDDQRRQYDPSYDAHKELFGHTECSVCEKTKPLQTIIMSSFLDIRFGQAWWNGHYICEDCLVDTVLHGKYMCKYGITFSNGKTFSLNEVGAIINGK